MLEVVNHTEYPTKEVVALVRRTLRDGEADRDVTVTVRHTGRMHPGYTRGWWRSYWYPDRGESGPQILVRLPRPGHHIDDYVPYSRTREEGRRFPLADWREALVAVVAHEGEHHRQWYALGERRGRRGSGRRRVDVEVRCDLAAYRAWRHWRETNGQEVAA